jgi:spore germination protein GerM
MAEQQRANRIPLGVIAGLAAASVAAAGGAAWWAMNSHQSPTTSHAPSRPEQPSPVPPAAQTAQVYWLKDTGNHLDLVKKPVTVATNQSNGVLEAAFMQLLAGPTDASVSSTIPQSTKLRSVTIQNDGIHVDLSQEFTTGGGSASMSSRVAQVLYTATSLQPNAKVWIDIEGKPLEVLGGEGLLLEQPLTRESFEKNFTL